ncbi:hypothetical protein ABKN59_002192 [Abortiporus biennis]
MVFSKALLLTSFVAISTTANAYWIFGGTRPLVTTRLDSIINPGTVSSHVHSVVGGSRFQATYDYNDLIKSQCSTIPVQPDKSNYWAPQLYYHDPSKGTYTLIPTSFNIYYLMRPGPKNEKINAFPTGLRMIAGDPLRRVNNASSFADQAISYHCLDYNADHTGDPAWDERADFFQHQCPGGMRAQVFFPSCWDGKNLDSADHKSHMAYPIQNYNSGDCPSTHPVHLISLFYEMFVSVDQFPYVPGNWVFSFGDNTVDQCTVTNGDVTQCGILNANINNAAAAACKPEMSIPNENVGFTSTLTSLPGCNPLWVGTGPKPTCNPAPPTPGFGSVKTPLPSGWHELGCIAEGTSGRALSSASITDPNMTKAVCANYCGFSNGAVNVTTVWSDCSSTCAGNVNEDCGGPNRLTLLYNPSKH